MTDPKDSVIGAVYGDLVLHALEEQANDAQRYQIVRRMRPLEFTRLYDENIRTGVHFDELVDSMRKPIDKPVKGAK